jgi:hypothetical protein
MFGYRDFWSAVKSWLWWCWVRLWPLAAIALSLIVCWLFQAVSPDRVY